ncbi:hypothetical protein MHK_010890 [Candidatus Magnetomorum sp. HK-1]|nr:hypothetical protein MHK_010890 [Candidatus Magnetomorum sp. HK-1]
MVNKNQHLYKKTNQEYNASHRLRWNFARKEIKFFIFSTQIISNKYIGANLNTPFLPLVII